ncbi:MAG: molybdopterin cofactor-binding domain-containing protein [Oscillospiraceae bacterium]
MTLTHKWLNINGADRMFICDPEKDTLATVLRRLGLTGVKIGCGVGVCGACTVILDNKTIRSCNRKIKTVKDYSSVTTIEGIGSPNHLHPLQLAFMTYGAVQCGFCTPGFIVSAYGLLQENPNPTREEVRDWFQEHKNVCRCTGYQQITDAVMAAARVMRGEATMQDITYQYPADGNFYGGKLPRPTALAKVCGVCDFGDDVALKMPEETLHLAVVMPRVYHHAKILSIDFSEAEKMPGVVKVLTAKDVKGNNRENIAFINPRCVAKAPDRALICEDKILRWGDICAVVAADTRSHARAAAAAVKVELEQLPEYLSFPEAAMPDALQIHEGVPNVFVKNCVIKGNHDVASVLEDSAHVVEGSFYSGSEPHLTIESDMAQAYWEEDGTLTVHCKAQHVYGIRQAMAKGVGVELEKLRIIENPTGASFGYAVVCCLYALPAIATVVLGKPTELSLSYEEHQHFSGKRSASYTNARLGCDEKGKLTGVEFTCGLDHGAYGRGGDYLLQRPIRYMTYPYFVPNAIGLAETCYSNFTYGTAYRGFGSVQIFTASESLMDMLAVEMKMDPFEFRYLNVARPGDTTLNSAPYRDYVMEDMMNQMRPYYEDAKHCAKEKATPEKLRGIGFAWGCFNSTIGSHDRAEVALELLEDGSIANYNTWEAQGQGADIGSMMHTCAALKELGITPDQVRLVQNDSKLCPDTGVAAGSRCHFMAGHAINNAAKSLLDAMRKPDGTFRTYAEMVAQGIATKYSGVHENIVIPGLVDLDHTTGQGDPTPVYMYSFYMAEVEVDVATGKATCVGMTCIADIGQPGNELSVLGQAYGGISHSIGFALTEDYRDMKKHANIVGAGIPQCKDIPDNINVILRKDNPRAWGPNGSSGCSECFQSGGHMSVVNAIYNATGVRIYELPATPDKIKRGMEALARKEKIQSPAPYYLGGDLYEEVDQILCNPIRK